MKKLTVIVFENKNMYDSFASRICENFSNLDDEKEFCGSWGEIQSNANEVVNSISTMINHFIESNKKEVIFGCCEKNYNEIVKRINLSNCILEKINAENALK